jgi:very-short-patch-repair endonuclease
MSRNEIESTFGIGESAINIIFKFRGISKRTSGEQGRINGLKRRESRLNGDEVERLYSEGIGVGGIGDRMGVAPNVIRRLLEDRGVHLRNRSEQQFARMGRTSFEERQCLARKANETVRGRPTSKESRIKAAKTYQEKRDRRSSDLEKLFEEMMSDRGINLIPQTAIGRYNCDFTINSVAVEIWGGGWHFTGEHAARFSERTNEIFDCGFDLLILPFTKPDTLTSDVADHIATFLKELSSNPPIERQYWVIWGAGQALVTGGRDAIDKALVSPFKSRRNLTNGRYETVLR